MYSRRYDPYPAFTAAFATTEPINGLLGAANCAGSGNNVSENIDPPYKLSLSIDELLSPSRSHRVSKKPNRGPPRPQNPWILFRKDYEAKMRDGHAGLHAKSVNANEISCLAGEEWRKVSPEVKQYFKVLARTALERHKLLYPNYKYAPKRRGRKNEEETLVLQGPKYQHLRPIQPSPYPPSSAVTIATAPRSPPPEEVRKPDSPLTPPMSALPVPPALVAPLTPPAQADCDNDGDDDDEDNGGDCGHIETAQFDPLAMLGYSYDDRLYTNPSQYVMDATDNNAVYTPTLGDPCFLNPATLVEMQAYDAYCDYLFR